jgi:hypothetical protein
MERVYRITSCYHPFDLEIAVRRLTKKQIKLLEDKFLNHEGLTHFFFDGKKCTQIYNDAKLALGILTVEDFEMLKELDEKTSYDLDGWTKYEDITKEVLWGIHDLKIYDYAKDIVIYKFEDYVRKYQTKDNILDKIIELGPDSLSENDKLFLADKRMKSYFEK